MKLSRWGHCKLSFPKIENLIERQIVRSVLSLVQNAEDIELSSDHELPEVEDEGEEEEDPK